MILKAYGLHYHYNKNTYVNVVLTSVLEDTYHPQLVADFPQEEDVLQEPEEPMEEEPEEEQD